MRPLQVAHPVAIGWLTVLGCAPDRLRGQTLLHQSLTLSACQLDLRVGYFG